MARAQVEVPLFRGLEGVPAGETAIATVGKAGQGLMYRGYSIEDLTENCIFEEVAYLLLYGALPTQTQLNAYTQRLASYRELSSQICSVLELIPKESHPMDVLKTACAMVGTLRPESESFDQQDVFDSLIASFGSMMLYHYHFHKDGRRINTQGKPDDTVAKHFVRLLHQTEPNDHFVRTVDISLILYAEHGYAASTFNARVTTSTLSDAYSAICSAIGTLRGPLHGGANEAAMALIEQFKSPQDAEAGVRKMLKERRKIMGFGHRVYKTKDPRNAIIKECSRKLSELPEGNRNLYDISETIEKLMWDSKHLFANLDFFAASAYHQCGVPTNLFTPIFVIARTSGWGANIIEQRTGNRIFRPLGIYTGPELRKFIPINKRIENRSSL